MALSERQVFYRSMLPDLIIYVSEAAGGDGLAHANPTTTFSSLKKARGKCVGYLRIPVNGKKRHTENWELGQDLTIVTDLWTPYSQGSGV